MADAMPIARLLGAIAVSAAAVWVAAMVSGGVARAGPAFPSDDKGFLNSAARCDANQTALAIGRTQRSLVVICVGQNGH